MQNGTLLIQNNSQTLHTKIVEYFNNPLMTKLHNFDVFSYYYVKLPTMTLLENYYIIAGVINDKNKIGTRKFLKSLNWNSFQTRILKERHDVPITNYRTQTTSNILNDINLDVKERNNNTTCYKNSEYNITVTVFHKNLRHPDKTILTRALEEYMTILKFN